MKKLLIAIAMMIACSAGAQTKGDVIVRKSRATKKIDTLWVNPDGSRRISRVEYKSCEDGTGALVIELVSKDSSKAVKTVTVRSDK